MRLGSRGRALVGIATVSTHPFVPTLLVVLTLPALLALIPLASGPASPDAWIQSMIPTLAAQDVVVATPSASIPGGSRVESRSAGVEFPVPDGFTGQFDAEAQGIVFENPEGIVLGIWAVSRGEAADLADAAGEMLLEQGVQLELRSEPETVEGITVAELNALIQGDLLGFVAAMKDGEAGNSIVAAAIGPEIPFLRSLAVELVTEASLTEPVLPEWTERAAGLRLTSGGTDSAFSPGGAGAGSYASRTTAELALCRNGRYAFQSESESYMSVMGAGGIESTSRDAHDGRWSTMADVVGRGFLVLESTEGNVYTWPVEETLEGALVDGTPYAAEPGPC